MVNRRRTPLKRINKSFIGIAFPVNSRNELPRTAKLTRSGASFGKKGGSFPTPNNQLEFNARGKRTPPKRPTNPHDPFSKDPFLRAGMGLGTNKTKIFKRAGMNMS